MFFIAVTLLGYSRREAGFLGLTEIFEQYRWYCQFNGIKIPDDGDDDYDDDFDETKEEVM